MNNKLAQQKPQKWPTIQSHFRKLKPKKTIEFPNQLERSNSSQWIKTILTGTFKKSSSKTYEEDNSDTVSTISAPLPDTPVSFSSFIEEDNDSDISVEDITTSPPLRYKVNSTNQRLNKRHYMIRPFEPTYEIELQKNQWLQLDLATSKQIERLRRKGFSRITIRQDSSLKKHIQYGKQDDVLLELSLFDMNQKYKTEDNQFSVRRTYWWQASDQVGTAYLPNYTTYKTHLSDPSLFKPLKYAHPPSYLDESTISF